MAPTINFNCLLFEISTWEAKDFKTHKIVHHKNKDFIVVLFYKYHTNVSCSHCRINNKNYFIAMKQYIIRHKIFTNCYTIKYNIAQLGDTKHTTGKFDSRCLLISHTGRLRSGKIFMHYIVGYFSLYEKSERLKSM